MSKRSMATQGGDERYGAMGGPDMGGEDDKPRQATAAQLARRKILSAKGTRPGSSNRSSRAGSPAVAGGNPFAQAQSFQAPPAANGFNFSAGGLTQAPTFGQTPQTNGNPFGAPAQDQAQQNGGSVFGGFGSTQGNGTPSFGSTFGSNTDNSQPQQNGFNAPASFSFGQSQNTPATAGTSFNFGQTRGQAPAPQQPQTNGFKPNTTTSFGNSFGGSQPKENGAAPVFSFGQSQPTQEQTSGPSGGLFNFGGQAASNTEPAANGNMFGQPAPQSADKPVGTGLFGSTPAPEAAKSADSIFSALKPADSAIKPGMFTQSQQTGEQTPKPFSFGPTASKASEEAPKAIFSFGQAAEKRNDQQTPKPAGAFTFGQPQQSNDETPKATNLFSGFGKQAVPSSEAPENEQTPKPAASLFNGLEQSNRKPPPGFSFSAPQTQDTSMMSPENTPQKQSSGLTSTHLESTSQTPSTAKPPTGDIFSRISRPDPPATAPRPSFASFGSFGQSADNANATSDEATPSAVKDLFSRITYPEPPATEPRPSSSSFGKFSAPSAPSQSKSGPSTSAATSAPSKDLLQPSKVGQAKTKSMQSMSKLRQLNEGLVAHLRKEDPSKDWSIICQHYLTLAAEYTGDKSSAVPSAASSSQQMATPSSIATPKPPPSNMFSMNASSGSAFKSQTPQPSAPETASKKRAAEEQLTKEQTPFGTEKRNKPSEPIQYPSLPETASNTAKLFASTLDKPVEKPISSLGPPKDVMDKVREQKAAKEAAEKASPENTPRPSSAASFKPSTTFTPSTNSKFGVGNETAASSEEPAETPKAPTFGFKPSTASSTPAPIGFKPPSFGGAADSSSGNFLASFGKKASEIEEKAMKERKAADYDSDDDEAEWEAKDRAEQEAKRRKIEEAAKNGPSFAFPTTTDKPAPSSTPFAFKLPGADKPAETKNSTSSGSSLFGHLKSPGGSQKPAAPSPGVSLFAGTGAAKPATNGAFSFGQRKDSPERDLHTDKQSFEEERLQQEDAGTVPAEKKQGLGDKTWKPETPIKFGSQSTAVSTTPATAPPANPFGGLFGSKPALSSSTSGGLFGAKTQANGDTGKLAPPSVGFTFGNKAGLSGASTADVSRATTPGVTTDGEASTNGEPAEAGEPSDEAKDPQIEDMTALLPEELEAEEVLAQAAMAKASKYDDKNTEDGMKKAWIERGKGPLYVLRNKTTKKVRILQKVPPLGRLSMNFEPLKGVEYKNPKPKFVSGAFIDHLETNKEKTPGIKTWQIQVREAAEAEKIAQALMDGRPSP